MSRLVWNAPGQKLFETGVDRGVLFVDGVGHAWSGLRAVNESPTGGDPTPYYLDGIKYLNIASAEEFEATIEALSAPKAFDLCQGRKELYAGLMVTEQPRKSFAFSYRTLLGNDIESYGLGYKIHLVYNALARPAARSNSSIGSSVSPNVLSWSISTTPPLTPGLRPTSHWIVDSTLTDPLVLEELESLLYGTDITNASIPSPAELITLFGG